MGKKKIREKKRSSYTLPPSPTHSSSSSSDFEFIICQSKPPNPYSSADELFYKGQLLPLHRSSRLSMVQTLISTSSSSSSTSSLSSSTAAGSRDSTGSTSSSDSTAASLRPDCFYCDSNRPSSAADDIDGLVKTPLNSGSGPRHVSKKSGKYGFSLARFSSVFKNKEHKNGAEQQQQQQAGNDRAPPPTPSSSVKRMSSTAREVIHKYLKKVKPLYEKLSQKQQQTKTEETCPKQGTGNTGSRGFSITFSGNLMRKKRWAASCPSSMRSSPNHSGVLSGSSISRSITETSSMEELQNAIQGAIAHCKSSMSQDKTILVGQ